MKLKIRHHAPVAATVLLLANSCRKPESATGPGARPAPVIAAELATNQLKSAPQGLLASRAASPVRWQLWEPKLLQHAADSQRLIFAFIGSAQYPGCVEALDAIDRDPTLVDRINREFVPVLVDSDLARETALAAGNLSMEIRQPVSFPFLLVLSPEGNEVTWRPVSFASGTDLRALFEGAADVVSRMWVEDPEYVNRNSSADHANRVARLTAPQPKVSDAERDRTLRSATRQLVSLYDEDIGSLSGTGGLLPLGTLQCLASASLDPATAPDIAARCRAAVKAFGNSVLGSAMVDPLDGGIYSSRRANSWSLPMPNRTCMTQARAARALVTLHSATGNPRHLEIALGAARFAEARYATADDLFATQRQPAPTPGNEWLWTSEQIEQALSPEEAAVWKNACGVSDLGNLTETGGQFFRLNSLGLLQPLDAVAKSLGIPTDEATRRFESGRGKLQRAREARSPTPAPIPTGSAGPSFRMVSAYCALFTATGDPAWREKALSLAQRSRAAFSKGAMLVEQAGNHADTIADGRAFTYALATQAALDLAEITLDENWRIWAGDLATTTAENFIDADGRLTEARAAASPLRLTLEDRVMLFDDSTAGVMRMNLARLQALDQNPPPALTQWLASLPDFSGFPVVHTDTMLAESFGASRKIVEVPANPSPEWREAACRLPLDRIARRIGKGPDARILHPDGSASPLDSPAALAAALQPAVP